MANDSFSKQVFECLDADEKQLAKVPISVDLSIIEIGAIRWALEALLRQPAVEALNELALDISSSHKTRSGDAQKKLQDAFNHQFERERLVEIIGNKLKASVSEAINEFRQQRRLDM